MDDPQGPASLGIIAWSGDLDRVWPTLVLSSTGAASGMPVTVFFTFWGLLPLVRDDVRITGDDRLTRLLSRGRPPGLRRARLSSLDLGGIGRRLMRRRARAVGFPEPEELLATCLDLGVELWPCQTTMDLLGIRRDQLIDGVGDPVGSTTALSALSRSSITLFI